jgi:hypothetical protein
MEQKISWDKIVLYLSLVVAFIYLVSVLKEFKPKPEVSPVIFDTTKVDDLQRQKDSLDAAIKDLTTNFKENTSNRVNNINAQNNTIKNEINLIPSLRDAQRDSIWAILLSSKDSLPTRYWDLLEQRTGRKSP